MKKENILNDNIGNITLVDSMGDDLSVVNSARLSFGGNSAVLDDKDRNLIRYLANNNHSSPFRHAFCSFHVLAPEMVLRQWYKHTIGCSWVVPDFSNHGWNELSGRYTKIEPRFYLPTELKGPSKTNKQGSAETLPEPTQSDCMAEMVHATMEASKAYETLLGAGVSKEQARLVLPTSFYTEVIWTASLQALAHFCKLRTHEHSQWEIRQYAKAIEEICVEKFPVSFPALLKE